MTSVDDDVPLASSPTLLSGQAVEERISLVPIAQVSDSPLAHTIADSGGATLAAPLSMPGQGASTPLSVGGTRLKVVAFQNYAVEQEVATGGIGRILQARDTYLNRPVALKEILKHDVASQERFIREARITARLQHPSIVPVYEAGKWPSGEPFYAMKLVTGQSFDKTMAEAQTLDQRLALLPHVIAVAEAMAYAHHERIIHRDLKPQNVLSGPYGETVVIDWGLAKDLRYEPAEVQENAPSSVPLPVLVDDSPALTIAGAIVGTPAYMPPEQAEGHAVDERADVYAIGAILYHLLAGRPPYESANAMETLRAVRAGPPEPIERVQPGVPRDLATIVQKAMAHKRAARYRTAAELALDLRRFQTGQIVGAHHYSRRERLLRFAKKNSRELFIAASALVTLAVVATLLVLRIVSARDDARRERDRAALAEAREASRADRLTLVSARAAVLKDPLEALAWLKTLSESFQDTRRARWIAADAIAHGIPRVFRGHRLCINHGRFSADGKSIVTVSDDHDVRIWDVKSSSSRVLSGHTDEVWSIGLSEDGLKVLAAAKNGEAREFDWATGDGRLIANGFAPIDLVEYVWDGQVIVRDRAGQNVLFGSGGLQKTLLHSPKRTDASANRVLSKDRRVLAFGNGGEIVLIDLGTKLARTIPWSGDSIHTLGFSDDGALLSVGTAKGLVGIVDVQSQKVSVFDGHKGEVRRLSFFPHEHQFLTVGMDGVLEVWDAAGGSSRPFRGHDGPIYCSAISHDGRSILTGSADHTVRLWDVRSGAAMVFRGAKDSLSDVAFSPDDSSFFVSGYDGSLRVYSFDTVGDRIVAHHEAHVTHLAVSPNGKAIASASVDGSVLVTGMDGRSSLARATIAGTVNELVFSPDGNTIAIGSMDSRIALVSRAGGAPLFLEGNQAAVRAIRYAPNGSFLVSASADGKVLRMSPKGGAAELLFERKAAAISLAISPDGMVVSAGYADGALVIYDLGTRKETAIAAHRERVSSLVFSPSGKWIASGGMDHSVRIWDSRSAAPLVTIDAAGTGIHQILFFPDETKLATLGGEANARIWSTEDGRALTVLRGQRGVVNSMSLAPDGARMATGADDGSIFLWDLESGEVRNLEGHRAPVNVVAFADEGRMLVSGSKDQTVRRFMDSLPFELPALRAAIESATTETVHSLGVQTESQ